MAKKANSTAILEGFNLQIENTYHRRKWCFKIIIMQCCRIERMDGHHINTRFNNCRANTGLISYDNL